MTCKTLTLAFLLAAPFSLSAAATFQVATNNAYNQLTSSSAAVGSTQSDELTFYIKPAYVGGATTVYLEVSPNGTDWVTAGSLQVNASNTLYAATVNVKASYARLRLAASFAQNGGSTWSAWVSY